MFILVSVFIALPIYLVRACKGDGLSLFGCVSVHVCESRREGGREWKLTNLVNSLSSHIICWQLFCPVKEREKRDFNFITFFFFFRYSWALEQGAEKGFREKQRVTTIVESLFTPGSYSQRISNSQRPCVHHEAASYEQIPLISGALVLYVSVSVLHTMGNVEACCDSCAWVTFNLTHALKFECDSCTVCDFRSKNTVGLRLQGVPCRFCFWHGVCLNTGWIKVQLHYSTVKYQIFIELITPDFLFGVLGAALWHWLEKTCLLGDFHVICSSFCTFLTAHWPRSVHLILFWLIWAHTALNKRFLPCW